MRALKRTVLPVFLILAIMTWSALLSRYPVTFIDLGYFVDYGNFAYAGVFLVLALVNYVFGARQAMVVLIIIAGMVLLLLVIAALPLENVGAMDQDETGVLATVLMVMSQLVGVLRSISAVGPVTFLLAAALHIVLFHALRNDATRSRGAFLVAGAAAGVADSAIYFSFTYAGSGLPWTEGLGYAAALNIFMVGLLFPIYLAGAAIWGPFGAGKTAN